jgi:hypothetical protein
VTGDDEVERARPDALPPPRPSSIPSAAALVAILAAGFGFVCTMSYRRTSELDGEYSCSGFDAAPVAVGAVALVAGVVALVRRRPDHRRAIEMAAGLAGIVLGVVHVLRGLFDIFGELC